MAGLSEHGTSDGKGKWLNIFNLEGRDAPRHTAERNDLPSGGCIKWMVTAILLHALFGGRKAAVKC